MADILHDDRGGEEDWWPVLSGGDIYEWAHEQVQADWRRARTNLGLDQDPVTPTHQAQEHNHP